MMSNILDISDLGETGYDEITINIVGNVDSGKSSLCGILSHNKLLDKDDNINKDELKNILDDGNGKSRARVLSFKHEQESGRTSSISYNYMRLRKSNQPKIVSLIDLAGHSKYLKTTINGISGTYPECGFVLISKNITHITKEHYSILATMKIPILFILTKIDLTPTKILNTNIENIKLMCKKYKKELIDLKDCFNDSGSIQCKYIKNNYFVKLSNTTGVGYDLLLKYISNIRKQDKKIIKAFSIDTVYNNITGFGMVVAGINRINIKSGDNLFIGPFENKKFIPVKIRSIHNDYRQHKNELKPNIRGCLCIKLDLQNQKYKKFIKTGTIITDNINIRTINKFRAYIAIFRGNSSNIKIGYNSYINIGMNKGCIKINKIWDKDTNKELKIMETKWAIVEIQFMTKYVCVNIKDTFLFRSDRVNGIGKIIELIE